MKANLKTLKEKAQVGNLHFTDLEELTQILREDLLLLKFKEFGVGDWPYESGRNKGQQEYIKELLGE
jgi:hypothetical protein